MSIEISSSRPYLIRALYEWITANNLLPYIVVNSEYEGVITPKSIANDQGKLIFNISSSACRSLELSDEYISFKASFSGSLFEVYIPMNAVLAIFPYGTDEWMVFNNYDLPGGLHGRILSDGQTKSISPKKEVENESPPPNNGLKVIK